MKNRVRRYTKPVLCAALLAGGLAVAPFGSHRASAFLGVCFDDPIVSLSNGMQLQLSATVGTAPGHVKGILYVVHVPANLTVTNIQLLNGPLTHKSVVVPLFDGAPGTYSADVLVTTTGKSQDSHGDGQDSHGNGQDSQNQDGNVQVLADEQATDTTTGWTADNQVTGQANQVLHVSIQH